MAGIDNEAILLKSDYQVKGGEDKSCASFKRYKREATSFETAFSIRYLRHL
ncbi:MAG: hypothetical protein IJY01_06645 [Clostridia bacterium]|nr:hypothetical protein [Clostridia bacterium]MBQ8290527.1 hypothetical protein [Clostridia bacterium]